MLHITKKGSINQITHKKTALNHDSSRKRQKGRLMTIICWPGKRCGNFKDKLNVSTFDREISSLPLVYYGELISTSTVHVIFSLEGADKAISLMKVLQ